MDETPSNAPYNRDTVQAVLDAVREEYLGQERRHNLLVSKTQTLATVTALLVTAIVASGGLTSTGCISRFSAYLGLLSAITSVTICVYVLRSRQFHKIAYKPALTSEELKKNPEIVMANLTKTYDDAITKSAVSYEELVCLFDKAILFLLASIVIGGISILSTSLGGKQVHMANETSKSDSQETQQPRPPQPTETSSYGTETVKRSQNPETTGSYGTQKIRENNRQQKHQ